MKLHIRPLDPADRRYALSSWRECAKTSPQFRRVPWDYFKKEIGAALAQIINDESTTLLGAYTPNDRLIGWLAMTPGKRVHTLHWVHVKFDLDGERCRRRGVMTALLDAAQLGSRFLYTFRARRDRARLPDGSMSKSLDESLVAALRSRGIVAAYTPIKEWLK